MTNFSGNSPEKLPENNYTGSQESSTFPITATSDWTTTVSSTPMESPAATFSSFTLGKRSRPESLSDDRDFNLLSKSELVNMVKSLQEQNLLLTRCLAESHARNFIAPASSVTQKNTHGITASKHAPPNAGSQKDFPSLPKGKSSRTTSSVSKNTATTTPGKSFSKVAQTPPTKKTTQKKNISRKATPQAKEWAVRLFQNASGTNAEKINGDSSSTGYTFIYLPSKKRTTYSELRDRLKLLGINLNRVYSIGRPAKHVISLLIHQGYEKELLSLCDTTGVKPITDFSPTSGATIGDPELLAALKSDIQKEDKAKSIFYNNLLRSAVQLRDSKLGLSILKFFNTLEISDKHYVPEVIVTQFIKLKPQAIQTPRHTTSKIAALGGFDAATIFESLESHGGVTGSNTPVIENQIHANTFTDVNADTDTEMNGC